MNIISINDFVNFASVIDHPKDQKRNHVKNNPCSSTYKKIKTLLEKCIQSKLNKQDVEGILPSLMRICALKEKQLNEISSVKKVLEAINRLEISGYTPQFDEKNPAMIPCDNAKNFMKFIFSDQPISFKFINSKLLHALFFKKNPTLLKEVRVEFQNFFMKLADQLNDPEFVSPHQQKLAEILIGNLIALYPFFEPNEGDLLTLPQKINSKWEPIDYRINLLKMTPSWKGDPYYACALSPVNNTSAISHLAFMGTPPPTSRGAAHAVFSDLIPGTSVGQSVYQEGKKTIENWVDSTVKKTNRKINIYGQSLGGSLCQILLANKPEKIGKIFAYNPPSLWKSLLNQCRKKMGQLPIEQRPEVNIFCQERDPVYSLGAGWDPSWNVYQVVPKKPYNHYEAHIRAFSAQRVILLKLTEEDIRLHNTSISRRIYTIAAEILRVPLFIVRGAALGYQILKHHFSIAVENIRNV